jgi:hypothetical protein
VTDSSDVSGEGFWSSAFLLFHESEHPMKNPDIFSRKTIRCMTGFFLCMGYLCVMLAATDVSALEASSLRKLGLRSVKVHYLWLREPSRGIPNTAAILTPFLSYRNGRDYNPGNNIALETDFDLPLTTFASTAALIQWRGSHHTSSHGDMTLLKAYLRLRLRPLELQIGRDNLFWGKGSSGLLGFSGNTRPFDFVKLSNADPFRPPWIFRYLGSMGIVFFFARMDDHRPDYDHPYLSGLHVNMEPKKWLEIGVYRWMLFGGEGAPTPDFIDFLTDFFLIRPGNLQHRSPINNGAGMNVEIRLPHLRGIKVYTDIYWEDTDRLARFGFFSLIHFPFLPYRFNRDTASKLGFSIPNVLPDGKFEIEGEHVRSAIIVYRHHIFRGGFTFKRRLLGHDLGPSAQAGYVRLSSQVNPSLRLTWNAALEYRGDNPSNTELLNAWRQQPDHARVEWRYRFIPGLVWLWKPDYQITGQVGYERVRHFNYIKGLHQHNAYFEVGFERKF